MPSKDYSKHWVDTKVICPYYKRETAQSVRCEGMSDGNLLHINFCSKENKKDHKKSYCCSHRYTNCPLARIHRSNKPCC